MIILLAGARPTTRARPSPSVADAETRINNLTTSTLRSRTSATASTLAIATRQQELAEFNAMTAGCDAECRCASVLNQRRRNFKRWLTHKGLMRDPKDEILKAFRLFDDDETGKISFKNLKRVTNELGERMTDEELQDMIDEADRDGDGEVNEEESLRIMKKTNLCRALSID